MTPTTAQDPGNALVARLFGATIGTLESVHVVPIENDFFRFYRSQR